MKTVIIQWLVLFVFSYLYFSKGGEVQSIGKNK